MRIVADALENYRPQLEALVRQLPRFLARSGFPNWVGLSLPSNLGFIEEVLLNEGIPLAWVPRRETAQLILDAGSPSERRRIIGRRWKSISEDCLTVLDEVDSPRLAEAVQFAREAALSLVSGFPSASQALSASLLDTVLRQHLATDLRGRVTGMRRPRLDIDDYPFQEAIVLGAIFGAHGVYDSKSGERAPRVYSRHASAHSVTRRQYSRVNAVLALMNVASFLRLLQRDGESSGE